MALKHIPTSWRDDMRTNVNHNFNFYMNPRGRVFPSLTSAGISYIKNDSTTNMRGTYRMQCGASTDLTYLYTLPQRFIIEGWFKPEFAYNVASDQTIFASGDAAECIIKYNATSDKIQFITSPGTDDETAAYTTDAALQKWHYIRAYFDNTAKKKGCYLLVNGTSSVDSETTPGAGTFIPLNTISFMPTVAAESSYWIIHELDETLATGEYKTYQADRQIIFDFNGTTLGRERIRIPLMHSASDQRGVKSFSISKSVENPMTGSAGANSASIDLLNNTGSFSDDQYDAFDPFQGYYNGTEKYLQNRVNFEIESLSPRLNKSSKLLLHDFIGVPEIPDKASGGATVYRSVAGWTSGVDSFASDAGTGTVSIVSGVLRWVKGGANDYVRRLMSVSAGSIVRVKVRVVSGTPSSNVLNFVNSPSADIGVPIDISGAWNIISVKITGASVAKIGFYVGSWSSSNIYTLEAETVYNGTAEDTQPALDNSGHAYHATMTDIVPVSDSLGVRAAFPTLASALASPPITLGLNDFTFAFEFKCATVPTAVGGGIPVDLYVDVNNKFFPLLYDVGTHSWKAFITINGTTYSVDTGINACDGVFRRCVVRGDRDGNLTVHSDGVLKGTVSIAASAAYALGAAPLRSTANYSATYYMSGYEIGHVCVDKRLWSDEEIAAYSAGNYPVSAYTYAHYLEDVACPSSYHEPVFIGRTTPGAFKRNSPSRYEGGVTIDLEDGVSELGETKLTRSYTFDGHDLSKPSSEADSLIHDVVRLVTKKEVRNYCLNSSFENATIANSWTASGLTLTRDNTYAQFGTYSAKAVVGGAGQYFRQVVKFETNDLIDVGDIFNFSAFIRQGTASTVKIQIEELDTGGSLLGSASETACGTDTGVFTRVDVTRTILSSSCTQLRITFYGIDSSTFYADGAMLTRGIDPVDYFLLNATDGSSGSGSADSAATYLYDTVAIDADAVAVTHPYALIEQGGNVWEPIKSIGDASIAYYVGMTADGVFRFASRYAESDPATIGAIEDGGGVATSLDVNNINAVKVHGVIIKRATLAANNQPYKLWNGTASGLFTTDEGGFLQHPIPSGELLTVTGNVTTIEARYSEDVK